MAARLFLTRSMLATLALGLDAGEAFARQGAFNIPPETVEKAIADFGRQSGLQVVAPTRRFRGVMTQGLSGAYEPRDALKLLLSGTGLEVASDDGYVIVVHPAPSALAQPADSQAAIAAVIATDTVASLLSELFVTGSRVIQNGNNSPTPVTIVSLQQLSSTRPTTLFEGLLDLPVFSSSTSAVGNPAGAGGSSRTSNALNLRGLGIGRTLVLYDGHRVPSTSQDGTVEISSVPQQLLQRVDVVTGGASAVYGSDAMTGVVNFITDRSFNGVKSAAQYGLAQYGGDHSYDLSAAAGRDVLDGRGHFEASVQRHWDEGAKRLERDFLRGQASLQGSGTTALPFFYVEGAVMATYSAGGKIIGPANNPLLNYTFNTDGVATPFRNGISDGFGQSIQLGGDGVNAMGTSLKSQLDSDQAFARFDYDVTNKVHTYVTASYTQSHQLSFNTGFRNPNLIIPVTNAFLAPEYRAAMAAQGITSFTLAKQWNEDVAPTNSADFWVRELYTNAGLEAALGSNTFEASYTHSIAKLRSRANGAMDNGRLFAALDAVADPASGKIVCNVTLTNPGLYPGCVPVNIFGPTADKDQIAYFRSPREYYGETTMDDLSASLVGAPLHTWAGPVNTAVSGEWRRLGYSIDNDSPLASEDPLPCTGLRFGCTPGMTARYSNGGAIRTPVHMDVTEGALEAEAPIIRDGIVQSANISGGLRQTHYAVTGNTLRTQPKATNTFDATTWKLGLTVQVNDALALRATRSRDIRAPNLNELYQPQELTNTVRLDTLTNQATRADQIARGNPNLTPEIGYTWTVGMVLKPTQSFSLAVDGYDIRIQEAIQQITGYTAVYQNACYDSGGASLYCTLLERTLGYTDTSSANVLTRIFSGPLNIAEQVSYGVDFEANYRTELAGRPLSFRGFATYQPHIILRQPAAVSTDSAGIRDPIWRATTYLRYSLTDLLTLDVMTKWRSRLQNADPARFVFRSDADRIVEPATFTNVTLTYRLGMGRAGQADLFLNVSNVFDKDPPPAAMGNSATQSDPGRSDGFYFGDDPMGRAFNVGIRMNF